MIAQLIPLKGGNPITLVDDITIVGRQRDVCDLVIDSKSVSKMHCILIKTDGLLYVRDLSSTNGTRVNGQRITRGALLPGDRLDFASEKFKVHLGPDGAEVGGRWIGPKMIVTPHDPDADTPRPQPGYGSQAEQFR